MEEAFERWFSETFRKMSNESTERTIKAVAQAAFFSAWLLSREALADGK